MFAVQAFSIDCNVEIVLKRDRCRLGLLVESERRIKVHSLRACLAFGACRAEGQLSPVVTRRLDNFVFFRRGLGNCPKVNNLV